MSDWTYEMLRYAFSWNDESSEKALKYVVTGRSPSDSMSEFQMPGSRVISSEGVENPENWTPPCSAPKDARYIATHHPHGEG